MPQYAKAVRDEKTAQAVELRAKQRSFYAIAKEIGVTAPTAKKWVEDEHARRAEHRGTDKEAHLAVFDAIQREAWTSFEETKTILKNSEGVAKLKFPHPQAIGYLNTIKACEDSKVKITGAEAPKKFQDVTEDTFEIVFDDDDLIPSAATER